MKRVNISKIRRIQSKLNERIFIPDGEIKRIIHRFRKLLLPNKYRENEINWCKAYLKKYYTFRTDRYRKNKINIKIEHNVMISSREPLFWKRVFTRDLSLDLLFKIELVTHDLTLVSIKSIRRTKIKFSANYNFEPDDFYFYIHSPRYNWSFPMFVAFPHSNSDPNRIVYLIFKLLHPLIAKILEICRTKKILEKK